MWNTTNSSVNKSVTFTVSIYDWDSLCYLRNKEQIIVSDVSLLFVYRKVMQREREKDGRRDRNILLYISYKCLNYDIAFNISCSLLLLS